MEQEELYRMINEKEGALSGISKINARYMYGWHWHWW